MMSWPGNLVHLAPSILFPTNVLAMINTPKQNWLMYPSCSLPVCLKFKGTGTFIWEPRLSTNSNTISLRDWTSQCLRMSLTLSKICDKYRNPSLCASLIRRDLVMECPESQGKQTKSRVSRLTPVKHLDLPLCLDEIESNVSNMQQCKKLTVCYMFCYRTVKAAAPDHRYLFDIL